VSEPRSHRITPTPRPSGADLDVTGYVRDLVVDLVVLLRERPTLMDDLCAVVDNPPAAPDPFQPERSLPVEHLAEALCDALPTSIRLHRAPLAELHARLGVILARQEAGPRPLLPRLPEQQDRRAS
jgi:hypothetical protein